MLTALKNLRPNLAPVSVMTDFERAAINGFQAVFSNAESRGCFFHFSQAIYRKIQSEPDIKMKYEDESNLEFALHIRELAALAFVPPGDVILSFDILLDSDFYRENQELLTPLLDYFEATWLGRPTRGVQSRRPSLFPINLWNCYSSAADGLPKTNNAVEGWHRSFSSLISSHHPTIWKFIDGIKKDQFKRG